MEELNRLRRQAPYTVGVILIFIILIMWAYGMYDLTTPMGPCGIGVVAILSVFTRD